MRVGTSQIYTQSVEAFNQQQAKLLKLQQQISTGVRLTKPSDDPLASAQVLEMEQVISLKLQYQVNIGIAESRLEQEETALAGVENLIFRMRELAVQANSGALDATAMNAIGVELEDIHDALLALANTQDTNGDFLFAGFQNQQQPFTETVTGSIQHVVYNGDQGQRSLQISETRQILVDDPGREIFLEIPSATALNELTAAANAGTGVIAPAHVYDASLYAPGTFEIYRARYLRCLRCGPRREYRDRRDLHGQRQYRFPGHSHFDYRGSGRRRCVYHQPRSIQGYL